MTYTPKISWYSWLGGSASNPKRSFCIEVYPLLVTNMAIYMDEGTIYSAATDAMIWKNPHKLPVSVTTFLILRCDTSSSFISLGLISGWISPKVLSVFSQLKNWGWHYSSLVTITWWQLIRSYYVGRLVVEYNVMSLSSKAIVRPTSGMYIPWTNLTYIDCFGTSYSVLLIELA